MSSKSSQKPNTTYSKFPKLNLVAKGHRVAKQISIGFVDKKKTPRIASQNGKYKYIIYPGNNSELIRILMKNTLFMT